MQQGYFLAISVALFLVFSSACHAAPPEIPAVAKNTEGQTTQATESAAQSTAAGNIPSEPTAPNSQNTGFEAWLQATAKEAVAVGIHTDTVENVLLKASLEPTVIKLDQNQPPSKFTFDAYVKRVLPDSRIRKAKELSHENRALLTQVSNTYRVPVRFIIALWGVESNFGQNMGNFSVVNSLATLAYEGRRGEFFKKELFEALHILDDGDVSAEAMKGSWAGAMGQTQFMPSNFRKLAVDFNRDGKKDIWSTRADVFASIAHYLSSIGWDPSTTWGRRVKLPAHFDSNLIGIDKEKTLSQWQALGVRTPSGKSLAKRNLTASLIQPDAAAQEYYLVYPNYKCLLHWNKSLYFATSVGLFADKL